MVIVFMDFCEASDIWWGRVEINIVPFCVFIYDLLAFVYGGSDGFLIFFSRIFVDFCEVVIINKCLDFVMI